MTVEQAKTLLAKAGLEPTPNRLQVLTVLSGLGRAVSAPEILEELGQAMNKVTLYRILDLLVDEGLVFRHSSGDRAFRYCLGRSGTPGAHVHFYCTRCNQMDCLPLESIPLDLGHVAETLPMRVDNVEIRLDGLCEACRKLV